MRVFIRTAAIHCREVAWAVRRLARRPWTAAVAVATVALALTPSLVFQLVSRAVLPPLPFDHADRLVSVWQPYLNVHMATSYPKLRYLSEHSRSMDVAFGTGATLTLDQEGRTRQLMAMAVTPSFFRVLGTKPHLGRLFQEDENSRLLDEPVVILSEHLWREQFGAAPDIVGQTITLTKTPFTVVGVMPGSFRMAWWDWRGLTTDAWVPAMMAPLGKTAKDWFRTPLAIEAPNATVWAGVGRMRPGYDLRAARAEVATIGAQVGALWHWPDVDAGRTVPFELGPLSEDSIDPKILHAVALLRMAGGLVLLLGGLNLASLFLARGFERSKALGLRVALGAPRLALVSGLVTEAAIVGVLGGLAAVALTRASLALLGVAEPSILTAPFGMTFDPAGWRVDWALVGTAVAVAVIVTVAFSLAPALRTTRSSAAFFLRTGEAVARGGLQGLGVTRPGGLLVAAEMALALALMAPALLLVRSLDGLLRANLGFRPDGVATAALRLPAVTYDESRVSALVARAVHDLAQAPGVESASWTSCLPVDCAFFTSAISAAGSSERGLVASVHVVAPAAFRTLAIPMRAGRDFGSDDRPDAPSVVILSERAAKALRAAPGDRVDVATMGARGAQVIGIVGDVPYGDLAREPLPAVYFALTQKPQGEGVLIARSTTANVAGLAAPFRAVAASVDSRIETLVVSSLEARVAASIARFRGATWLLGAATLLALVLSAIGVYGLLSSLVTRSVPEIGIRMALGASPRAIARTIARAALGLGTAGALAGASVGMYGASWLRGYLYGVRPWDTWSLLLTLATAGALAVGAAFAPARRASRVDPMVALRCE